MKNQFPGYYRLTDNEFVQLWDRCIFVIDANVLLNIYRYPKQASDEMLAVLGRVEERIWVPFQAALEYQRNRLNVIAEQKKRFRETRSIVGSLSKNLEGEFSKLKLRDRHALIDPDRLIQELNPIIARFQEELERLEETQPNVHDNDALRDEIDKLLTGKVGPAPTRTQLEEIYSEGEDRFNSGIPPGYMDKGKENDTNGTYSYGGITYQAKFGDLLLWKQIIGQAQTSKIGSLIFITDDEKEDWWWTIESDGKKKLGPRPELVEEITRVAEVKQFHLYNTEQFLKFSRNYLNTDVSESSIEQVRQIAHHRYTKPSVNFRYSGFVAESAVVNWVLRQLPEDAIAQDRDHWPDLTVELPESGEKLGIEVKYTKRGTNGALIHFREQIFKAYHAIHEFEFTHIELVLVIDGDIEISISKKQMERFKSEAPKGVGLTIGRLVKSSTDPTQIGEFNPIPHLSYNSYFG